MFYSKSTEDAKQGKLFNHPSKPNKLCQNSFLWNINDTSNMLLICPQLMTLERNLIWIHDPVVLYLHWVMVLSSSSKAASCLTSFRKRLQRKSPHCFQEAHISLSLPLQSEGESFSCHGRPTLALCTNAVLSLPKSSPKLRLLEKLNCPWHIYDKYPLGVKYAALNYNFSFSSPVAGKTELFSHFFTLHQSANSKRKNNLVSMCQYI